MSKRGQITVFILVGMILLLTIASIVYVYVSKTLPSQSVVQTNAIENYIQTCLQQVVGDGLNLLGRQGGYYHIFSKEQFLEYNQSFLYINQSSQELSLAPTKVYNIPFYYKDQQIVNIPSKEKIAEQLVLYLEENFPLCINKFQPFMVEGFTITDQDPQFTVSFLFGKTVVLVSYPLVISHFSSSKSIDSFEVSYPVDLTKILLIVETLLQLQKESENNVIIGNLAELSQQHQFNYTVDYLDQNNVLYLLFFEADQKIYTFNYVAQYQWKDILGINDPYLRDNQGGST